jgi:hypothetical protein
MWAIQHIIGGATVAQGLKRPWLAYPAAYFSHWLLDFTFHVDNHALFVAHYQGPPEAWPALAALDVLSALAVPVTAWILWKHPLRWLVITGGFLGYLMDLTGTVDTILPWDHPLARLPVLGWINSVHHSSWHHGNPKYFPWQWGIACQMLVMCVGLGLLTRSTKRAPATEG